MKRMLLSAAIVMALTVSGAMADTIHFETTLIGTNEVPPNGSPATGFATGIFDIGTNTLCVHVEFSGLLAGETAAHVHTGPPGVAGPVFMPLTLGSPSDTCQVISAANIASLQAGNTYVNVHSAVFPGGEIRGQFEKVPEPSTLALLGFGIVALVRRK